MTLIDDVNNLASCAKLWRYIENKVTYLLFDAPVEVLWTPLSDRFFVEWDNDIENKDSIHIPRSDFECGKFVGDLSELYGWSYVRAINSLDVSKYDDKLPKQLYADFKYCIGQNMYDYIKARCKEGELEGIHDTGKLFNIMCRGKNYGRTMFL